MNESYDCEDAKNLARSGFPRFFLEFFDRDKEYSFVLYLYTCVFEKGSTVLWEICTRALLMSHRHTGGTSHSKT